MSVATAAFFLALQPPTAALGQDAGAVLRQLETRFDEARATALHLLAPRAFDRALDRFDDANERYQGGRTDDAFQDLLNEASERLSEAERIGEAARPVLAAPLAARAAAVEAEAEQRATQSWQTAEAELEDAGRRFESGDTEAASERGGRAVVLYERAARAGLRDLYLGAAIAARTQALQAGGSELAPTAFARGEADLAQGESEIESDRAGVTTEAAGQSALAAFERSGRLALLADSIRRRTVSVERLADAHDDDLQRLADAARLEVDWGATEGTANAIEREVRRLGSENDRLEDELEAARDEISDLNERAAALETELAATEQRFFEARDDLLEVRDRDARLREAQGLFTPEEGEVFTTGNRLVLRLFGLTFESGSADIDESQHPLLTKVQRVITTFDGATIRIEGHTDSQGGAEANQALSQRRAIAVREHLLTRIPIPSTRVEAIGLGEEQPIGSNETEAGRARNRRIEVVLTLQQP